MFDVNGHLHSVQLQYAKVHLGHCAKLQIFLFKVSFGMACGRANHDRILNWVSHRLKIIFIDWIYSCNILWSFMLCILFIVFWILWTCPDWLPLLSRSTSVWRWRRPVRERRWRSTRLERCSSFRITVSWKRRTSPCRNKSQCLRRIRSVRKWGLLQIWRRLIFKYSLLLFSVLNSQLFLINMS